MPRIKNVDSLNEYTDHMYDSIKSDGYAYEQHILQNVLSPELFANKLNDTNYRQVERMFEYLINAVRQIKLTFAIAFPKNSKHIN